MIRVYWLEGGGAATLPPISIGRVDRVEEK